MKYGQPIKKIPIPILSYSNYTRNCDIELVSAMCETICEMWVILGVFS